MMMFHRKHVLARNIAFIDGQSGSGKSLIGPIVSSLKKSEYWLHDQLFEEIIILLSHRKISLDAARSILGIHADMDLYNLLIARDVNFRDRDTSGVSYGNVKKRFQNRLKLKDGDNIVDKINSVNPFLLINTHHILMNIKYIEKVFHNRNIKLVSIQRNPITLIKNFYENNWEKKYLNNQREFTLTIKKNNKEFNPWYLNKYSNKKLTFIEKYTHFVVDYQNFQNKLSNKNHILIKFEEFINNPDKYAITLEKVFGEKTATTRKLLKSFGLPRSDVINTLKIDTEFVFSLIKNEKLRKQLYLAANNYG